MTVFADQLDLDGRLLWYGLEVSTDDFATILYAWATLAGSTDILDPVTGNPLFFEQRLLEVGNIQRGLGNQFLPIASTCSVVLDNTDFAADALCNHDTAETTTFAARFRLSIGLGDESGNVYTKQLGTFVCLDLPSRDNGHVYLSLADDALGKLSDLIVPPTPADWLYASIALGESTGAIFGASGVAPLFDWTTPTALQFGVAYASSPYVGCPLNTFNTTRLGNYDLANWPAGRLRYLYPILVLATKDLTAIDTDEVKWLRGVYNDNVAGAEYLRGKKEELPEFFNDNTGGVPLRLWKAYKTDPISVLAPDGTSVSYALLWIAIDMLSFYWYRAQVFAPTGFGPPNGGADVALDPVINGTGPVSYGPPQATGSLTQLNAMFAAFRYFEIQSLGPGSQVSGNTDPTRIGNPVDVLIDLVESYSVMGAGAVDATRAARARAQAKDRVRGEIIADGGPAQTGTQLGTVRTPYGVGTLRKALAEVASSSDIDLYVEMGGKVGLVTQVANFETQTSVYPTLDETRIANYKESIPSSGQRWTPANRVFVQGEQKLSGPYDEPNSIQSWKRIVAKTIQGKWWQSFNLPFFGALNSVDATSYVWENRGLEAKVRPVVEFTTDVGILALDLGDYFLMSVSRGGNNAAYTLALWKLEAVTIAPNKGSVEVNAVWCGDLQTTNPWLLDNEDLVVRAANGGATLTVTTGSTTIVRSAGSFITAGLAAGDIILMRDSSEALTGLTRNRGIKVVSITDATHAVVADSVFGAAGAHVLAAADWTMQRSYLTYPTAVTDAANYPSGGAMYGKVSNTAGLFSDGSAANKLLDG